METTSMIISIATLVVAAATLFVTAWMLVYMKKSDIAKSKRDENRRKKDIMAQIESKKNELERMNTMSRLVGSGVSQQQIFKLENEISELYSRL